MTFKELDSGIGERGFDKQCIEICKALNSLPGVHTFESCCGHLKDRFKLFAHCTNFESLAKIAFIFDRRYCGTSKRYHVNVTAIDSPLVKTPPFSLDITSESKYEDYKSMNDDLDIIINNIKHWNKKRFAKFFKTGR